MKTLCSVALRLTPPHLMAGEQQRGQLARMNSASSNSLSTQLGANSSQAFGGTGSGKLTMTPAQHRACLISGQALIAVVNDPRNDPRKTYFGWRVPETPWQQEVPAPIDPVRYPPVSKADLQHYLSTVDQGKLEQFRHDRDVLEQTLEQELLLLDGPSELS